MILEFINNCTYVFPGNLSRDVRTCRWSKLANSQVRTKLTNSLGKQRPEVSNLRDQVVLLETEANLCAVRRQTNDFYAVGSLFLS